MTFPGIDRLRGALDTPELETLSLQPKRGLSPRGHNVGAPVPPRRSAWEVTSAIEITLTASRGLSLVRLDDPCPAMRTCVPDRGVTQS